MTLPEGVAPSGPTAPAPDPAPEPTVTEAPVVSEPVTTDPAVTAEEPAPVDDPTTAVNEAASDAELRTWAKDNGIEDVPASGRLSAAWRDQIIAAMAAALDPKAEVSAVATPPESSTSVETTMTEEEPGSSGEEASASTEPVQPEFDNPWGEYRSVFQAPDTFMTGQAFTN